MMILETCNASVQRDIAGAEVKFDALLLDSYPVKDVTVLATEALRLIHILAGSYVLPMNLGTKLIKKVTKHQVGSLIEKCLPYLTTHVPYKQNIGG